MVFGVGGISSSAIAASQVINFMLELILEWRIGIIRVWDSKDNKGLFVFWKNCHSSLLTQFSSLITRYSSFITHHSLLKMPQFSKPHTFGTLFLAFYHLNIYTVWRTHILALGQIFANVHVINKKKAYHFPSFHLQGPLSLYIFATCCSCFHLSSLDWLFGRGFKGASGLVV